MAVLMNLSTSWRDPREIPVDSSFFRMKWRSQGFRGLIFHKTDEKSVSTNLIDRSAKLNSTADLKDSGRGFDPRAVSRVVFAKFATANLTYDTCQCRCVGQVCKVGSTSAEIYKKLFGRRQTTKKLTSLPRVWKWVPRMRLGGPKNSWGMLRKK